jgi:oxygen-independent coproporphyrinogen-3 oxidase
MVVVQSSPYMEHISERLAQYKELQSLGFIVRSGDFFPSVHYPPITMYPPLTPEELLATYTPPADGKFDIYAHVPFCRQRCLFCHYPVQLGERSAEKDQYLSAFAQEMDIYMERLGYTRLKARSILVGGGTPTYLALDQLERFLQILDRRLDRRECTQYNYDVDPVTLIGKEGNERLKMMRDYGVDRLTIGVQSLNPATLKLMNRHHGTEQALEAISDALKFGFQVNIEFIFGYLGQTLENWIAVIEQAVGLGVHEIQLYRLKFEAYGDFQGPVKHQRERHPEVVPTVQETLAMKQAAINILNVHGYRENLRRVFSKQPEYYSHYADKQCCGLLDQLGFGLTAFSSLRDRFGLNTQSFDEYYRMIGERRLPLNRGLIRSWEQQIRWAIVLPLKNRRVWKNYFHKVTNYSLNEVFRPKINALKKHGLLTEDEEKIELTPLGAFFADEVAQQFHYPDHIPFPRSDYANGDLNPYYYQEIFGGNHGG